ncbi:MAG: acyl-CoA/acyl-ACP dehydrogenase [Deltaproteobacteria bacterium]|nr:acyl-CoA/acyl-ACP dehydrogenase [Deltaproteobacteria bacterium]
MDFGFSGEQQAIRSLAREILQAEATPERVKQAETGAFVDRALWKQCAEANLLGIAIAEEHGGMGMGLLELCVFFEELGRAVAPGPWFSTLVLGALPIAAFGTAEQQRDWLPRVAAGEALLSGALDDAGSRERQSPATRARKESAAAGDWSLHGAKRALPCAEDAAALLIPAAPEGEARAALFLAAAGGAGISLLPQRISTGEPRCDLRLDAAPAQRLGAADTSGVSGTSDEGGPLAWLEAHALAALCAMQVGVSESAMRIAAKYTSEREQFGVPIGSFQAVQQRLADCYVDLEAMRWTLWRAAARLAAGRPALREARIAKWWAAEAGARIAGAALHLHGGIGADVDYPIHRHFLWSKSLELQLGGAGESEAALGRQLAQLEPAEEL